MKHDKYTCIFKHIYRFTSVIYLYIKEEEKVYKINCLHVVGGKKFKLLNSHILRLYHGLNSHTQMPQQKYEKVQYIKNHSKSLSHCPLTININFYLFFSSHNLKNFYLTEIFLDVVSDTSRGLFSRSFFFTNSIFVAYHNNVTKEERGKVKFIGIRKTVRGERRK